jgi:hypothetical protein
VALVDSRGIRHSAEVNANSPLALAALGSIRWHQRRRTSVGVHLKEPAGESEEYPICLPVVRRLDIQFASPVTFFVGENGTGQSTVIEAIRGVRACPYPGAGPRRDRACEGAGTTAGSSSACGHRHQIAALNGLPLRQAAASLGVSKSFVHAWRVSRIPAALP